MNILCTIAKITIGILFGIAVLIVYALAMAASMADSKWDMTIENQNQSILMPIG